ncbi:MAG: hypothetical protein M3Y26_09485 [Actinomycetota bacterium]|nr:hypothetical protein [Actinomycetota bacterium]
MPTVQVRHLKKRAFLAAYAELGTVTHAAKAANVHRTTHTDWLAADPDYAEAFEVAKEQAIEKLEREAIRRAVEGVDKPVYQGGKMVGTIREYSDVLLIFQLKALRPDKYRERFQVQADVTHHEATDKLDADIAGLLATMERREESPAALEPASPPGPTPA